MAIEPLGSVMAIQNQTFQKVETKPVEVSKEVDTQVEKNEAFDATTVAVQNIEEKDGGTDANANARGENQANSGQTANNEQIRQAVDKINKSMFGSEAVFGIHEGTNRVTIKLVDKKTKEVIKELPPEKTLDMISRVWEMAGILVDEKR